MSRRTRRSAVDQCGRFRPQCGRFRPQCGRFSDRSAVVSHRSAVNFHTALRSIFTAVRSFPPAVRERFIPQCDPQIPHRGTAVRSSSPALRPRPVAGPRPVASNPLPTVDTGRHGQNSWQLVHADGEDAREDSFLLAIQSSDLLYGSPAANYCPIGNSADLMPAYLGQLMPIRELGCNSARSSAISTFQTPSGISWNTTHLRNRGSRRTGARPNSREESANLKTSHAPFSVLGWAQVFKLLHKQKTTYVTEACRMCST